MDHETLMRAAIKLAEDNVRSERGGPFGAVVVRDGRIVGRGVNSVTRTNDPSAHAEVLAIRDACQALDTFTLKGCSMYTSCEPCPMCLAAIYWARLDRIFYGNTKADAAGIGFDDAHIYREVSSPAGERVVPAERMLEEEAIRAFEAWEASDTKVPH